MKKKRNTILFILLAVCLLVVADSAMVVTYPNEFTVIKQFGKIVDIR